MNKFNIVKGILVSKLFRKPFYVHFYITRRCNLKCKMCNVWKQKDDREMTIEEIKIAAEKIKTFGVTHVVITGGEPLLRNDLPEIVNIFSKLGMPTRLQTNGLLLNEKKLDKIISSGINDITISLDTLDSKKQDKICGVKDINIAEKVVGLFKLLAKKMSKSMNAANIVVSHKNLEEVPSLIKFLDSIGIWSTFIPVNLSEKRKDYFFKAKADDFSFTEEDKKKAEGVYKEIFELKRKGYKILLSSKFLEQSLNYIKTGNKKWKCDAGRLYFSVFPDGQFSPCDEIPTNLNILDENFIEKYKDKEFNEFLTTLQNNCEGCFYGCWKETSNLINHSSVAFDRFLTLIRVKKKELFSRL